MRPLAPKCVLRTSRQMSWFLVGIPATSFAIFWLPIIMGKVALLDSDTLFMLTAIGIVLLIAIFLVKTTTLSLAPDAIRYRSLLHKVDIALADIVKVESAFGFIAFSYKPYQRIVVTMRKTSGEKEVILNGGLFDQREINQWIDACNSALHKK